ncbi:MAG: hypothetical protein J07HX64_01911 [halophilic archaeon J07HX64]|nr:MAG: hypothetical protein J07HX64_01911 [halophilic archaeon J07HX64]
MSPGSGDVGSPRLDPDDCRVCRTGTDAHPATGLDTGVCRRRYRTIGHGPDVGNSVDLAITSPR